MTPRTLCPSLQRGRSLRFPRLVVVVLLAVCPALLPAQPAAAATYRYSLAAPMLPKVSAAPIVTSTTVEEFYGYHTLNPASANPHSLALRPDEALFFLHRDSRDGTLSFGLFLDMPRDGTGGFARFLLEGAPEGARSMVRDDIRQRAERFPPTVAGFYAFRWYDCCSDGFAATGFEDGAWQVTMTLLGLEGIDTVSMLEPGGRRIPLGLRPGDSLKIAATETAPEAAPAAVPLPSTALILLTALAGFAYTGWRRPL